MKGKTRTAPAPYLHLTTLKRAVEKFDGWKADITTGKGEAVPGGKVLTIKHKGQAMFMLDLSRGEQTVDAIRWVDREFSLSLEKNIEARRTKRLQAAAPHCTDMALCLRDERGLTLRLRTKTGDEMTLTGCVEIDVSRG
jgi:hypothetical protein